MNNADSWNIHEQAEKLAKRALVEGRATVDYKSTLTGDGQMEAFARIYTSVFTALVQAQVAEKSLNTAIAMGKS
jgi:hypothetical protein